MKSRRLSEKDAGMIPDVSGLAELQNYQVKEISNRSH